MPGMFIPCMFMPCIDWSVSAAAGAANATGAAAERNIHSSGFMARLPKRPDRHDTHHSRGHVVEVVAVERPVSGRVGGQVKGHLAAGRDVHRMLARGVIAMAG